MRRCDRRSPGTSPVTKKAEAATHKAGRRFLTASTPVDLSDTLRPALGALLLREHRIGNQEVQMKRPQPKMSGAGMAVGVAWYREADWPRIKELFPDADQLHDSYPNG